MGLSPHPLCLILLSDLILLSIAKRSYPSQHCSFCPPLFPVLQKGARNSVLATFQHCSPQQISQESNLSALTSEPIQPIFQESAPGKVAPPQPLKLVSPKKSSFFKVVMVKHTQPVVGPSIHKLHKSSSPLRDLSSLRSLNANPSRTSLMDLVEIYIYITLTCFARVWS